MIKDKNTPGNNFELMKKILIMGLPGAGKTTLAKKLKDLLDAKWLNADQIRKNLMIGTFLPKEGLDRLKE